jgi:hypothetical protein
MCAPDLLFRAERAEKFRRRGLLLKARHDPARQINLVHHRFLFLSDRSERAIIQANISAFHYSTRKKRKQVIHEKNSHLLRSAATNQFSPRSQSPLQIFNSTAKSRKLRRQLSEGLTKS